MQKNLEKKQKNNKKSEIKKRLILNISNTRYKKGKQT